MFWKVKKITRSLIGEGKLKGLLDFFLFFNRYSTPWGGAFNGQELRKRIFFDILNGCDLAAIIETGTYRGTTTSFFVKNTRLKIYSCENHPRYFMFSALRLLFSTRSHLRNEDSRIFLRRLSRIENLKNKPCFFYLDAHWENDLPLREELQIILSNWHLSVIMIDDFQVPGDLGYAWDNYGDDKKLNLDYLGLPAHLPVFFPVGSERETGMKRGCVVLANHEKMRQSLQKNQHLKAFSGEAHP